MDWDHLSVLALKILAVLVLVALNGFFVATEFALVKVRLTQLEPLVARGQRRARMAQHIVAHLDAYLSAAQLGITLASLGLGWIGEPIFEDLLAAGVSRRSPWRVARTCGSPLRSSWVSP